MNAPSAPKAYRSRTSPTSLPVRTPYQRPSRVAIAGILQSAESVGARGRMIELTMASGDRFQVDRRIWAESGLEVGAALTLAEIRDLLGADDLQAAMNSAARLLGVRARTASELGSALRARNYPDPVIETVVADFLARGYLDDAEFARRWITLRTETAPRSNRLLKRELRAKGVDDSIVEESLESADLDDVELARTLAVHRLERMGGLPMETRRRRIIDFLQRRGFGWNAIGTIDRELLRNQSDPGADDDW